MPRARRRSPPSWPGWPGWPSGTPARGNWIATDTFLVNGDSRPYLRNSRHEAARAARLLSAACGFPVDVYGVVAPVGAERVTVKPPPSGVYVVPRRRLARWLRRLGDSHIVQTVDSVHEAARRSTTWRA